MDYTFVKGQFTEAQLEEAIIALFQQQDYTYVHGESIHRKYEDILLLDDLRSFMLSRYSKDSLTETELQKIIKRPSWMREADKAHTIRKKRNVVHAKLCMSQTMQINADTCKMVIEYLMDIISTRYRALF